MTIPESQLETWSHQGAISTSKDTYRTIKNALEDSSAPFHSRRFEVYLQGSYGNDTNVYSESDVDVVIRLDSCMKSDKSRLSASESAAYDAAYSNATYTYSEFKTDVVRWLKSRFTDVDPDGKAICIPGDGNRRNADILVAAQYRRYYSFESVESQSFSRGLYFFDDTGTLVENYPKKHSENMTKKHQRVSQRLKPTIRTVKNYRNWLVNSGYISKELAPSYFVEGLLWNAPDELFDNSRQDTIGDIFDWARESETDKLTTPSGLHWLVRDNRKTSWSTSDFERFLSAAGDGWTDWC